MNEDVSLTSEELAALDLLIAHLGGEGKTTATATAGATGEAFFTPAIARTAIAVTRVAIRYTPAILEAVGAKRLSSAEGVDGAALSKLEGVNVDDLIRLREQLTRGR